MLTHDKDHESRRLSGEVNLQGNSPEPEVFGYRDKGVVINRERERFWKIL